MLKFTHADSAGFRRLTCPCAPSAPAARETDHEFYRRLETEEVARVVNHFGSQGRSLAQAYADMIVIGYYTGFRLSDVAELERSELSSGGGRDREKVCALR